MNRIANRMASIGFASASLFVVISGAAFARDIELDFHFLKLGQSRKAVINMLGKPNAETESQTLTIKYRRLMWIDPEGRKYNAAFISDRLFRWKSCSAVIVDC